MHLISSIIAHVYDEVQTPSGIPVGQEKHVIINKVGVIVVNVLYIQFAYMHLILHPLHTFNIFFSLHRNLMSLLA